jgi:hypothetical protein
MEKFRGKSLGLSSIYCGRQALLLAAALLFLTLSGCSSLSKNQLKTIETFAASCDSFSLYPSLLFREMSNLRVERGTYYASSLATPELRFNELNEIYDGSVKDTLMAKKLDLSMKILERYSRALKSLAHPNRTADAGREFRSLGRNLDSLVLAYNGLELTKPLPSGLINISGRVVGYGAELIAHRVRSRALREYIIAGDSLVSPLCDNLSGLMTGPEVKALIENEQEGLKANYFSYMRIKGADADISEDRRYLSLLDKAASMEKLRKGTSTAVNSLRRAHNKMAKDVVRKKKFSEIYDEVTLFTLEVEKLSKATKKRIEAL